MEFILVIGANGFIGRRILNDLSRWHYYRVIGCSLGKNILPEQNYHFIQVDIREEAQVKRLFERINPDVVINASALSVPDYCETHQEEAFDINIDAVQRLARYCNMYKSKLIHLSTDFVFDGKTQTLYTERDKPDPVNFYGITKFEGENRVRQLCRNYVILRVAVVYGHALPGQHGNILQLVAHKLRNKETIRVVSDQWRTPTFVGDISAAVEFLVYESDPIKDIFHICGSECYSIAEIAYRVADHLQLDRSLIQPVTTLEMNEATPRPQFSGLSNVKAKRELNFQPKTLEEGMKEMFGNDT